MREHSGLIIIIKARCSVSFHQFFLGLLVLFVLPKEQRTNEDKLVCLFVPGLALDHDLGPGPDPVDAVIALALAAVATAGMSPLNRHTQ